MITDLQTVRALAISHKVLLYKAMCHKGQNGHFAFTEETGFQVAEDLDVFLHMKINLKSRSHIGES